MKKRFGKIFMSSGLAVMIFIASFLRFDRVYAAASDAAPHSFYTYKKEVQGTTIYLVTDYYFMSNTYITTNIKIVWNSAFRITGNGEESSYIVEADGETGFTRTISSSGSGSSVSYKYTWEITLNNSSYFHFQVRSPASLWSSTDVSRYSYYVASQFTYGNNSEIDNSSYANTGVQANDYSIYLMLKQIRDNIASGGSGSIDLTVIEDWLEQIEGNQDSIISILNELKGLLSSQSGSPSSEAIEYNDEKTSDLNDISDQYNELESDFNSDFNNNLDLIDPGSLSDQLDNWTNSVTWYRTQMDNIYNGLGQFQFIATLALLLSLALIFIGR